ncbi:MAG TPA: bacterial transcriptional activator domain-containing protein [Arenicellales bacterium]|nr:bacterial transcriptional activator domain-containing protein [Arenicellales bacterium]
MSGRFASIIGVVALCLGLFADAVGAPDEGSAGSTSKATPAVESLAAGRRAKGERDLARAERHFQAALAAAERDGEVFRSALEELTYHLPLMRVERYIRSGRWEQAERSLQDLLEQHQADEEKSRHLIGLIARLRDSRPVPGGVHSSQGAGRKAIEHVERILDQFLREHGRYPLGYDELNEILPAGRYPLDDYDIVHYVGAGRGYGLTLRSRNNPENLLSVQRTGLVQ